MKITNEIIYGIPMKECYVDLYDQYFYVLFGDKNLIKLSKAVRCDDDSLSPKGSRGLVFSHDSEHYPKCIYLWFPDREYIRVSSGTLAHELMHVIDMIAINKGLKHDTDNQEVYAQFMGYLFRNLLPLFKKPS